MTGTIERHGDHWDVRPTMADGKRGQRLCQLPEMSKARARDLARVLTERAAQLGTVRDKPPEPPARKCDPAASFRAWCDAWCEDRETRGLKSVDDDRGRLRKWILPKIGDLPVATFRQADLERFVEKLDEQVRADDLAALAGGLVLLGLGHPVEPALATPGAMLARDPWAALEAAELAGLWPDDEDGDR